MAGSWHQRGTRVVVRDCDHLLRSKGVRQREQSRTARPKPFDQCFADLEDTDRLGINA